MTYTQRNLIYWPTAVLGGAYIFDLTSQVMPGALAFFAVVAFATLYALVLGVGRP